MNTLKKWIRTLTIVTFITTACFAQSDNLLRSVEKSPVSPDGDVAGATTDLVLNLAVSMNPEVPGKTLPAGGKIRITLPPEFTNSGLPMQSFETATCNASVHECSTAAILQGWPQSQVSYDQYALAFEDDHTIAITALQNLGPVSQLQPGIKQIHLNLFGFKNPKKPGYYPITITAQTGPNGEEETGTALVPVRQSAQPNLNVTSVFNNSSAPNKGEIYQRTSPGSITPLPYDFLLWDSTGEPLTGVFIKRGPSPNQFLLMRDREDFGFDVVGAVHIDGPTGSNDAAVRTFDYNSYLVIAPVSGRPAALLRVFFRTSAVPGSHKLRFSLLGGNEVYAYVQTDPDQPFPAEGK